MFWWIVLAVVVVGLAIAWWTSGRARPRLNPIDPRNRTSTPQSEALRERMHGPDGPSGAH